MEEGTSKSFLRRFNLRDVQNKLGSLKRTYSHRSSRKETKAESTSESEIPPYKELYFQKQAADDILNELNAGYFQRDFDPIQFELQSIEDHLEQEEIDKTVDHLTAALEVLTQIPLHSLQPFP